MFHKYLKFDKKSIAIAISILIWATIFYISFTLYQSVIDQGVEGYPNKSQLTHLIIIPFSINIIMIFLFFLKNKLKKSFVVTIIFSSFIAIIPFLLFLGGGI